VTSTSESGDWQVVTPAGDSVEAQRVRASVRARLFERPMTGARLGRYEIGALLGRGGMGTVYSAFDPRLRRTVAIKILSGAATPEAAAMLRREAQALAALSDPHVVPIYEIGLAGERPFVVMERVDGEPLSRWLARHDASTRVGFAQVLDVLSQAGRGLAAAHRVGLVHRDFKPGNVLVGRDGRVRVVDFGLAELAEGDAVGSRKRAFVGTPAYVAPEQVDAGNVDARADQFAFCVTALEALTGVRPERLADGRIGRAALRRSLPRALARALRIGTAYDATRRHPDMSTLLTALVVPDGRRRQALAMTLACAAVGAAVAAAARGDAVITADPFTPPEPDRDDAHEELRESIAHQLDLAEQHRRAGRYPDAIAPAVVAQATAQVSGWLDLDARARLHLGAIAATLREGELARAYFQEAHALAVQSGDDIGAANAANAMLFALGLTGDGIDTWLRHGDSAVRRVGDPALAEQHQAALHKPVISYLPLPGNAADLGPDEAWVMTERHGGAPSCSGHSCSHDLAVRRWDATSGEWRATRPGTDGRRLGDWISFGRPVHAMADGEVIACWRNYPDHEVFVRDPLACACDYITGRSRCDVDANADPDDVWRPCTEVVRMGGNALAVASDDGVAISYLHLQAGSVPLELCPNNPTLPVPVDMTPRRGIFADEYLPAPDGDAGKRPRVARGDFIGRMGNTGRCDEPQLHVHARMLEQRADGGFDQLEVIELRFIDGWYRPAAAPAGVDAVWSPLLGEALNDTFERDGPIALWPDPLPPNPRR
jgi:hypothetical protein